MTNFIKILYLSYKMRIRYLNIRTQKICTSLSVFAKQSIYLSLLRRVFFVFRLTRIEYTTSRYIIILTYYITILSYINFSLFSNNLTTKIFAYLHRYSNYIDSDCICIRMNLLDCIDFSNFNLKLNPMN